MQCFFVEKELVLLPNGISTGRRIRLRRRASAEGSVRAPEEKCRRFAVVGKEKRDIKSWIGAVNREIGGEREACGLRKFFGKVVAVGGPLGASRPRAGEILAQNLLDENQTNIKATFSNYSQLFSSSAPHSAQARLAHPDSGSPQTDIYSLTIILLNT